MTFREALGSPPLLEKAWVNQDPVTVELQTPSAPLSMTRGRIGPEMPATIYYADVGYSGALKLDKNQVVLLDSPIKVAEFCIAGFPDFTIDPLGSLVGMVTLKSDPKYESVLKEIEDAGLTVNSQNPKVVLDSEEGWKITVVKESTKIRNSIEHYVTIVNEIDEEFGVDELAHVLTVFNYFLALCSGSFHFPSAVIGTDKRMIPVWGQIGRFKTPEPSEFNWFGHRLAPQQSIDLQTLFPKFWRRYHESPLETTAVIDCYVDSKELKVSGLVKDALAKSFIGLSILAEQVLSKRNQSLETYAGKNIENALACFSEIPYQVLDKAQFPKSTQVAQNIAENRTPPSKVRGPHLLNDVRNYVAHPLEKDTPTIKEQFRKYVDSDFSHYDFLQDLSQFYLEYLFLGYCDFDIANQDYRKPIEVAHFRN